LEGFKIVFILYCHNGSDTSGLSTNLTSIC
jgi:hypothetical protein